MTAAFPRPTSVLCVLATFIVVGIVGLHQLGMARADTLPVCYGVCGQGGRNGQGSVVRITACVVCFVPDDLCCCVCVWVLYVMFELCVWCVPALDVFGVCVFGAVCLVPFVCVCK